MGRALPTRSQSVRALERFVDRNRFTIAIAFPAVGAVSLVASATGVLPPWLAFHPLFLLFGTLVMRLPLAVALAPLLGGRGVAALGGLAGYAYVVEYVGVSTGWPYGAFSYGVELGPMVGGIPVALPVFFVPLVLNSYLLSLLFLNDRWGRLPRLALALALVLVVDLTLDPAAVALGFWTYAAGGPYYGVPLSNFAGWVLSGGVGVLAVDVAFDHAALRQRVLDCEFALDDLVSFVLLWGTVNVVFGNWLAVAFAGVLVGGLARSQRFDFEVGVVPTLR
ncbi:bisanhydrobacterioruberin hydratase [Haloarculaceae archaeon H-GB1-1]|nr:bisanhydrobacterioruberin hydratase [Haloarculaceae archaeon H-GB1-1]